MVFVLREKTGTIAQMVDQLGVHREAWRTWIRQAEVVGGQRSGTTTSAAQRITELEREVRVSCGVRTILKAASAYFARELDPKLSR